MRSDTARSSPRMRGTHTDDGQALRNERIIPADAGNTTSAGASSSSLADHPRGCGEHDVGDGPQSGIRGSSPRMRGTQLERVPEFHYLGIIPADAGNTLN